MRTWKVLAGFGAAWAGLLLGTRASAQTFGGTADVVEVEVPVQVVRDGQPVRGLTRDDFEVYDGRTRQTLTGFHAVDLAAPAAQRAATEDVRATSAEDSWQRAELLERATDHHLRGPALSQ